MKFCGVVSSNHADHLELRGVNFFLYTEMSTAMFEICIIELLHMSGCAYTFVIVCIC